MHTAWKLDVNYIANEIDPNLKFTFDVPSLNQDGTVPVLDVRLWAEGERIRHGFFRKPCASKLTIMERSALGH